MKHALNMWNTRLLIPFIISLSANCIAQTKAVPDSLQCFTPSETRKVAVIILQNKENQRLLDITNHQLKVKMELLADDDQQIILLNKVSKDKDLIIDNKNKELTETTKLLKRETRRKKFWKFTTAATAVVFGVLFVVLAVK